MLVIDKNRFLIAIIRWHIKVTVENHYLEACSAKAQEPPDTATPLEELAL